MTNYLEALNMKATTLAQKYCTAYNEGKARQKELTAAKKAANDALAQYNLELSKEQYREWAKEGNPVELAIRSLVIPNALKFSFKADDDDVMKYAVKGDNNYSVSLPMMEVVLGKGIFHEKDWFNALEKLIEVVSGYLSERAGCAKLGYQVEEATKSFKFPKGVDPLSDEGVIICFQQVMDKILFIKGENGENLIHATAKNDSRGREFNNFWTIIRESITAAAGVNKVTICNTAMFSKYILNAMHGILTNGTTQVTAEESVTREDLQKAHEASEQIRLDSEKKSAKKADSEKKSTKKAAKAKK